jgi:hypothetical protein
MWYTRFPAALAGICMSTSHIRMIHIPGVAWVERANGVVRLERSQRVKMK